MITFAAFALLAMASLTLVRLLLGPTVYDRVLAVNTFGTITVLFLCVFAAVIGRGDAIDIAILYALINFIATIAVLKFFRYRSLERALADEDEEPGAQAGATVPVAEPRPAPAPTPTGDG